MSDSAVRLGNELLQRRVLNSDQLRAALLEHARNPSLPFDRLLIDLKFCTREQIEGREEPLAKFGKYDLLRELGRGGMGVVYEARDRELGRLAALKLMLGRTDRPVVPAEEERFVREARTVAALPAHPAIVGLYEAGVVDGRRFIAMELVAGRPYGEWRGSATLREQIAVLRDVALGLHHAHEHGVIHRDLKPDNILVDAAAKPHLTDFGLAKTVGEDAQVSLTQEGMVVGTPAYMSPEQAQGLRSTDGRTDVWSLGVLLYEALAGRQPFVGQTAVEILLKASKNAAPPPSRIVSKEAMARLDLELENVCMKALAKKAAERYDSAGQFAADLERWLQGHPVKAPPSTVRLKTPIKPPSRAPLVGAILATAVLSSLALVVALAGKAPSAAPKAPAPAAPATSPPAPPPPLSLLERADLAEGSLQGTWTRDGAALKSESASGLAIFSLPVEPPPEYDVRVEFTPLGEKPDINVIAIHDGRPFQWYVGAQNSTWYGFGRIDGDPAFGHPTGARLSGLMKTGQRHVTLLEVRKDSITGWLDGRKLATLPTAGRELTVTRDLLSRNRRRLGLTTWHNPTLFHVVELTPR